MNLDFDLEKRLVEYFETIPDIQIEKTRQAILLAASLDHNLQAKVDTSGAPHPFSALLIQTLVAHGKLKDGRYALEAVLDSTKNWGGIERNETCENLKKELSIDRKQQKGKTEINKISTYREYYLKTLLEKVSYVNMSFISNKIDKKLLLKDIYVDLKTDLSLNLIVKDYKIIDWEIIADENRNITTPKIHFNSTDIQDYNARVINTIIADIQNKIDGINGEIAEAEKERPLILAPLWQDGTIENYLNLSILEVAAIANPLVVLGAPGSGKSTFAKFLTFILAKSQLDNHDINLVSNFIGRWPYGALTPIYIELRKLFNWEHLKEITKSVTADTFWDYIVDKQIGPNKKFSDNLWEDLINGNCIIILDGIDEIPIPLNEYNAQEFRQKQIIELAISIKNRFERSRIIFTSRPFAFETLQKEFEKNQYKTINLISLNIKHMIELSNNLYTGMGIKEIDAKNHSKQLNIELESVSDYLKNRPLFLTLMAILYISREDQKLPTQKGILLRESIKLLLERWTRQKFSDESLTKISKDDAEKLFEKLENIAYCAQNHKSFDAYQTTDIDIGEIYRELDIFRDRMFEIVDYLTHQVGIFDPTEPKIFRFSNRTFQEFLAGSFLVRNRLYEEARKNIQIQPLKWRETCLLMSDLLGRKGKEPVWKFISALLDYNIPSETSNELTSHWYAIWLASKIIIDQKLYKKQYPLIEEIKNKLISRIKRLIETSHVLLPKDRYEVGIALGYLGDNRDGVILKNDIPNIDWVAIPSGQFQLGTSKQQIQKIKESPWYKDWPFDPETPSTMLYLPEFYISRYPITNIQFESFVKADDGYNDNKWWPKSSLEHKVTYVSNFRHDTEMEPGNLPVGNVNWFDSVAFCNWLSVKLGENIRLPTETEWEKAARGEDGRIFPWGNTFIPDISNTAETGIGRPCSVGIFPITNNPWGKDGPLDMCGNVWEWCTTIYSKEGGKINKYNNYRNNIEEDIALGDDYFRVVRGGSYTNIPFLVRTSVRGHDRPSFRHRRQGFRIVKIIDKI